MVPGVFRKAYIALSLIAFQTGALFSLKAAAPGVPLSGGPV